MSEPSVQAPKRSSAAVWLAPLLLYGAVVAWQGYRMREQINPDAVAYIRNAQYIAEGRFADSVSGYWGPLLSWCIAPLMYCGVDGLYAARIVLAIGGAGVVLASAWLARSLVRRVRWLGAFALCVIAIDSARLATYVISPDLIMAAILLAYCSVVMAPGFARRRPRQILAGLLGGAAYLAKSYALPFFLAHFAFTVGLHFASRGRRRAWRNAAVSWAMGMLAFSILAGPWIGVLSFKYGRPTFSTAARAAHAIIGPPDMPRDDPGNRRLCRVPPGRVTASEATDARLYNDWSPLENREYFLHQAKYSFKTAWSILETISSYDVFRISVPALVLAPVLMSAPRWRARRRKAVWVLGTIAVYASGFLLVFWTDRYTRPFLFPICCVYVLTVCTHWLGQAAPSLGLTRRSEYLVNALVATSFAAAVLHGTAQSMRGAMASPPDYRRMALEMESAGCKAPIASLAGEQAACGLYLAYHLGEPFAGSVAEPDVARIEADLKDFGVQSFIVSPSSLGGGDFMRQTSWSHRLVLSGEDGAKLHVYTPPNWR